MATAHDDEDAMHAVSEFRQRIDQALRELTEEELSQPHRQHGVKRLFQYTSGAGLIGMLRSGSIWATHMSYMNDVNEGKQLVRSLRPQVNSIIRGLRGGRNTIVDGAVDGLLKAHANKVPPYDVYLACFSEKRDLLSQWRGYADMGRGFALGFPINALHRVKRARLVPCLYSAEAPERLATSIRDAAREVTKAHFRNGNMSTVMESLIVEVRRVLVELGARVKHSGFREEAEWRLVSLHPAALHLRDLGGRLYPAEQLSETSVKAWLDEIRWRVSSGMPTPYLELPFARPSAAKGKFAEVVVGPCADHARTTLSTRLLVAQARLGDSIPVHASEIPFRSF